MRLSTPTYLQLANTHDCTNTTFLRITQNAQNWTENPTDRLRMRRYPRPTRMAPTTPPQTPTQTRLRSPQQHHRPTPTLYWHRQNATQREDPHLFWCCLPLHKHQQRRSDWDCPTIHQQVPPVYIRTRRTRPLRTTPPLTWQQHLHLPKHYLPTNPWSGNGQSSERNPCYFSNGPFRANVHLPEPLPFTDHLRTLHRRHWNCCQQPKWSTTPIDIPQLQTPDYQVRTWTTQRRRLLTYPWRTSKARHWRQHTPQTIHEACFETTHVTLPITPPNSYQEKPNPKRTATCHTLLFHWQQTCLTRENTKQTTT